LRVVRLAPDSSRTGASAQPAIRGSRRVDTGTPDWWPAYQTAYLDLGYRFLPRLIEARLGSDEVAPLRFWVVGYEDGSQVFLLAALLEDAFERIRRGLDEGADRLAQGGQPSTSLEHQRRRLDALRIEIVATDLGLLLERHGRVFRLAGVETDAHVDSDDGKSALAPRHDVANLTISELGPAAAQQARAEVERLESQVADLERIPAEKLDEIADAGKIGILFERLFRPGIEVRYSRASPRFEYLLHSDRWRIEDPSGVLNEGAPWSLTFSLADVTQAEPPHGIDGVVVTNVLPWLALYAEAFDEKVAELPVHQAWSRIQRSVRRGGWILIDPRSESVLDASWADPAAVGAQGVQILVTTGTGVQGASRRYMTGQPIQRTAPDPEITFLGTRCVSTRQRGDLTSARVECDDAAAAAEFGAGFVRPCRASDAKDQPGLSCDACTSAAETLWVCFGVRENTTVED